MTNEHKLKIAKAMTGKKLSSEVRKKKSLAMKEWWSDKKNRQLMSTLHKGHKGYWTGKHRFFGEKHWGWKGGITPINKALRESFEYEEWRTKVFERDLYTCQDCGQVGGYLQADHIKRFADFPELRFELSNGQTLCFNCHKIKTKEEGRRYWKNQYSKSQYDDQ